MLLSLSGYRISWRNHFPVRICRSCSSFREWRLGTRRNHPNPKPTISSPNPTRLLLSGPRWRRQCRPRHGASVHAPPRHATGRPASWCPCHPPSTTPPPPPPPPSRRLRSRTWRRPAPGRKRRLRRRRTPPPPPWRPAWVATAKGGSVSTAQRTRRRNGERDPWARKPSAMRAGLGTSRGGLCPNTGPRPARRSCLPSTPILTVKFWRLEGKRSLFRPNSTTTNSFIRRWCSTYPTVTITWFIINILGPISGTWSSEARQPRASRQFYFPLF